MEEMLLAFFVACAFAIWFSHSLPLKVSYWRTYEANTQTVVASYIPVKWSDKDAVCVILGSFPDGLDTIKLFEMNLMFSEYILNKNCNLYYIRNQPF